MRSQVALFWYSKRQRCRTKQEHSHHPMHEELEVSAMIIVYDIASSIEDRCVNVHLDHLALKREHSWTSKLLVPPCSVSMLGVDVATV